MFDTISDIYIYISQLHIELNDMYSYFICLISDRMTESEANLISDC